MSRAVALLSLGITVFTAVLGACTNTPEPIPHAVELPRIAGRVLDARTGQPVAGAEISTNYQVSYGAPGAFHASTLTHASRWTPTDAEGRFAFEAVGFETVGREDPRGLSPVFLVLIDRRYGVVYLDEPRDRATWGDLEFRIEPNSYSIQRMKRPERSINECPNLPTPAYLHCCEVVYGGGDERCEVLRRRHKEKIDRSEEGAP